MDTEKDYCDMCKKQILEGEQVLWKLGQDGYIYHRKCYEDFSKRIEGYKK